MTTKLSEALQALGPADADLYKCVHCGLCAERCPTSAWDMEEFELKIPYADSAGVMHIPVRSGRADPGRALAEGGRLRCDTRHKPPRGDA